jgi:hypothetical protein
MRQMTVKNWFIPLPAMKCPMCMRADLVCRRYHARPGEICVICWRCESKTWVVDHRAPADM